MVGSHGRAPWHEAGARTFGAQGRQDAARTYRPTEGTAWVADRFVRAGNAAGCVDALRGGLPQGAAAREGFTRRDS